MPASSPEALRRKADKRRAKRRAAKVRAEAAPKMSNVAWRRSLPQLPDDISKADLRAMLAEAVSNTT